MTTQRFFRSRTGAAVALLSVLLSSALMACSSDAEEQPDLGAPGIVEEPTFTPAEATAEAELLVPLFEGEVTAKAALDPGDCFNEYTWRDRAGNLQQATTRVSCDKPHEGQVYLTAEHPAPIDQPYVGEPELEAYAQEICYEAFEGWVDMNYEESQLEIGVIIPDLLSWSTEPFARDVGCYLTAYRGGLLRGSMEGIGL